MECGKIEPKKEKNKNSFMQKINELETRIKNLEDQVAEKDRELREVAINRAEFVQQLTIIYDLLKTTRFNTDESSLVKTILNSGMKSSESQKTESDGINLKTDNNNKRKSKNKEVNIQTEHGKAGDLKSDQNVRDGFEQMGILTTFEPDKIEFIGKYSYRERLILMNRIDIYRIYITVIILSSQIKYPRALTDLEEKELKNFIDELSEFENLVLDLNIEDNIIWEKGKVCENQATQLFSRFFNI